MCRDDNIPDELGQYHALYLFKLFNQRRVNDIVAWINY